MFPWFKANSLLPSAYAYLIHSSIAFSLLLIHNLYGKKWTTFSGHENFIHFMFSHRGMQSCRVGRLLVLHEIIIKIWLYSLSAFALMTLVTICCRLEGKRKFFEIWDWIWYWFWIYCNCRSFDCCQGLEDGWKGSRRRIFNWSFEELWKFVENFKVPISKINSNLKV